MTYNEWLPGNTTIVREYRPGDGSPTEYDGRTALYPWHLICTTASGAWAECPGVKAVKVDETTITVTFDKKHPRVIYDPKPYVPPATPPEILLREYKRGKAMDTDEGDRIMGVANEEAVRRYGINFDVWTREQRSTGKGPGVGPAGIPVI